METSQTTGSALSVGPCSVFQEINLAEVISSESGILPKISNCDTVSNTLMVTLSFTAPMFSRSFPVNLPPPFLEVIIL